MKSLYYGTLFLLLSCDQIDTKTSELINPKTLKAGAWLFTFDIGDENIPFNAIFSTDGNKENLSVKNGEENVIINDIIHSGDSIYMLLPIFETSLSGKLISDTFFTGMWKNTTKADNYFLPFSAVYGKENRFSTESQEKNIDFNGKWEVTFSPESNESCKSIGLFNQIGNKVTGTFLTETGDYRFLEGISNGNNLYLSCFDGAHAFLFKASLDAKGNLDGSFWSGNHWSEKWIAKRNDQFELTHPDSITSVNNNKMPLVISFPDVNGKQISLNDPAFKGKVLIIQIMGTWCPNCADETRDFAQLYQQYKEKGLEIIAVAYERSAEFDESISHIQHFKTALGANYTFLFAGKVDKQKVNLDFPMLNKISSYPTAIYVDKSGSIRKIHTGYYGPGAGPYYLKYKEDRELFIEKLLSEKINI